MKLDETRFLVQTFSQTCTLARAELYLNTAVSNSKQFVQKRMSCTMTVNYIVK